MIIKNNKGMYLEEVVNNWCTSINNQLKGYFSKIPVNHAIISNENNYIKGILKENNNCDYIGIYKGCYTEFEAKETYKEYFNLSNIKPHQLKKLEIIRDLKGISFFIVYFHIFDRYFAVPIETLSSNKYKSKKIPLSWFEDNGIELFLENLYLNIEKVISHLFNHI